MILFLIISMVAAYASRNMIFEQRTSANNYRSTQAFEAAEAGMDWAIAMLNGGRMDDACTGTSDLARDAFRDRYLSMDADGSIGVRQWLSGGQQVALLPSCVRGNSSWVCSCPGNGDPVLAAPVGAVTTPAFKVSFEPFIGLDQRGFVKVFVTGCSGFGSQCFAGAARKSDAYAEVKAVLGLAPALTQTPAAAITVRGPLDAPSAQVVNPATVGVAINAGGAVNAAQVIGPAGMAAAAVQSTLVVSGDASLSGMVPPVGMSKRDLMFLATFGMPPTPFRVQPAVVRLTCSDDCSEQLIDAVARFPGRVIWIDGDLTLGAAAVLDLGSASAPVVLVVDGNLNWAAGSNVALRGLIYVRGARWDSMGAAATVVGAVIAEGDASVGPPDEGRFTITGEPRIVFDAPIVDHLKKVQARTVFDLGSFARVPGSWRDFR